MSLAPDHAFANETGASWCKRSNAATELVRNVARAMRFGAEFGHRSKVFLFGGCEAIEAHSKEALVEGGHRFIGGVYNVFVTNRTGRREVPRMFAPFLKEVRISLRFGDDQVNGWIIEEDAFIFGWPYDRFPASVGLSGPISGKSNRRSA